MPIYSADRESEGGIPQLAQDFFDKIGAANAVLISSAEHNGSPPSTRTLTPPPVRLPTATLTSSFGLHCRASMLLVEQALTTLTQTIRTYGTDSI